MASFLDPNDPRIQGPGAMAAADPAGDWFAAQGAPYQTQGAPVGGGIPDWQSMPRDANGMIINGDQLIDPAMFTGVGKAGQPATGGADSSWWNPQDPRGSINALFGGQPPSSQTILAHAPQLQAAGIQISPPNAEGVTSKINIPGVGWTRILEGGTAGGQGTGWNYVPQGVGGGSAGGAGNGMSSLGALAGGLDPSAAGRLGYSGGLGLTPQPLGLNMEDWQQDPGYQFRVQQGQQALERSAAAKGTLLTGGTAKALERYGQDFGSNEYGNVYNRRLGENTLSYNRALGENQAAYGRLLGEQQNRAGQLLNLANLGATSATAQGNLGSTYAGQAGTLLGSQAGNIGNTVTGAGNAQAASTLAQANAWAQGLQGVGQGANSALQMYYLSKLYGGTPKTPPYTGTISSAPVTADTP